MFQFWHCLTDWMMHHPVGLATVVHSLFREQSYHGLSKQDAARWVDLGTYRA
jgi:hypothetical protein